VANLILIIDDDSNQRKTLSDILKVSGYLTLTARDGMEGMALFRQNPVDVVLIDLRLPDVSGIDVLRSVKTDRPSAEAIIVTGSATLDLAIEATNRGAFSFIRKPYEIGELMLQVRRALEKQQAREQILRQVAELKEMNAELRSLHEVSAAITGTIDREELFSQILRILTKLEVFRVEATGSLFLLEGESLRLACDTGHAGDFLIDHSDLRTGECLCGLSARTGEVIVSDDCAKDCRHTLKYRGMKPHGHVVVPIKAGIKLVGILCLYTTAGTIVEDSKVRMLLSVGNQIGVAVENARLHAETKELSLHDPLTGLANRRLMEVVFERSFAKAKRFGRQLSIIMADIDHFKKYNDTHGHSAGDRALCDVAKAISEYTRDVDFTARYGGEEFFILLPDTSPVGAREIAARLREKVEAVTEVTISLGITSYNYMVQKKEDLITMADEALYKAKQNGRNRIELHLPPASDSSSPDEVQRDGSTPEGGGQ